MSKVKFTLENLYPEGICFSDLLPYIDIDDELMLLSDGSLGAIWEIKGINCIGLNEQQLAMLSSSIEQIFFNSDSQDIAFQLIYQIKPAHEQIFNDYLTQAVEVSVLEEQKLQHLKPLVRSHKLFITLRYFPQYDQQSIFNVSAKQVMHVYARHQEHMRTLIKQWQQSLNALNLNPVLLRDDEILTMIYQFLQPTSNKKIFLDGYDLDQRLVRDRVINHQPLINHEGIQLNNLFMRVASVKELPTKTNLGMLTLEHYLGQSFCMLDEHRYLTIVINCNVLGQKEAMASLNMQKSLSFLHRHNWLGDSSIEADSKSKQINSTLEDLYTRGKRIVLMRMHFITQHEDENQLRMLSNKIITDLGRLSMEGIIEDVIGSSIFLSLLPLNFDPNLDRIIKRQKRLLSVNASDFIPIICDYQGSLTPALVYLNRRHMPVYLDMFDSSTNPHGLVIGASGSGKSFLMNDFILQHQRLDSHFYVIDKGDSYYKTCQFLEGHYIKFDLNLPVRINPFDVEYNAQNMSFLLSLLTQMASGLDPRDRLNKQEEGLLNAALHDLYEQHLGVKTLSDLIHLLNSNEFNDKHGINSVMGPTIALRLMPFSIKGSYGGFFDGSSDMVLNKKFTVFELAQLSSYPELQVVVLMNLMFFLTHKVMQNDLKPKRKYILIDEAWALLNIKNSAEFITNAFKTFRKYRCSVIAITQELADLANQQTGLSILANTAFRFFLKQDPAVIDAMKDKLAINHHWVDMLKNVQIKKGLYAECVVIHEGQGGIIRLYPDKMLYAIANSEAGFNQQLSDLMHQQNLSLSDAILKLKDNLNEYNQIIIANKDKD